MTEDFDWSRRAVCAGGNVFPYIERCTRCGDELPEHLFFICSTCRIEVDAEEGSRAVESGQGAPRTDPTPGEVELL